MLAKSFYFTKKTHSGQHLRAAGSAPITSKRSCIQCFLLVALFSLAAVASMARQDEAREVRYVTESQIYEIVGCKWAEPCRRSTVNVNDFLYYREENRDRFRRWHDLYRSSSPVIYEPSGGGVTDLYWKKGPPVHYWKPRKWSDTEYHIFVPNPDSVYSALLVETKAEKLRRVYRMRQHEPELEFRPLEAVSAPSVHGRALVRASRSRIRDLAKCDWNEACEISGLRSTGQDTAVDLNRFLYRHRRGGVFSRWRALYESTSPVREECRELGLLEIILGADEDCEHVSSYSWESPDQRFVEYFISQPNSGDRFSALLYETTYGTLTGVYRIRPNGVEQEFRPLYSDPTLPLKRYRRRETWQRKRSTHHEDIAEFRYDFLTTEQVKGKYGLSWGGDFGEIQKARLIRGYRLIDPREFFKAQGRLQRHEWYMPDWDSLRKRTSERSWLTAEGHQVYLYCSGDSNTIRLLVFAEPGGIDLLRFYEYSARYKMKIVGPATQRAVQVRSREVSKILGNQISWGSERSAAAVSSDAVFLATPIDFFKGYGSPFLAWKSRFAKVKRSYAPTDGSWADEDGVYWMFRGKDWESDLPQKPPWYILQYRRDNDGDEGLVAIHHFDETWTPRVYVPYVPPPFAELLQGYNEKTVTETQHWIQSALWGKVSDLEDWLKDTLEYHYEGPVPEEAQVLLDGIEHRRKIVRKEGQIRDALWHAELNPVDQDFRVAASFSLPEPRVLAGGLTAIFLLLLTLVIRIRSRRATEHEIRDARARLS